MKQYKVFLSKDILEQIKNHKGIVIIILFCMVGIISPALAKLTP